MNVYICNNLKLMTNFIKHYMKVESLTLNSIFLECKIVKIKLVIKNSSKKFILNHWNIFYLSNNPSNLVNLGFLNNIRIYYNNKNQLLYNKTSCKSFIFT